MKPLPSPPWAARCVVGMASLLVPAKERGEWRREWAAELWHLCRSERARTHRQVLDFACGSFPDAWQLRSMQVRGWSWVIPQRGSAMRCGLAVAGWAVAGFLFCMLLPGSRRVLRGMAASEPADVVAISAGGFARSQTPTIRYETYDEWRANGQRLFAWMAFYRPAVKGVHLEGYATAHMPVAIATPAVLKMLEPAEEAHVAAGQPRLYFMRSAWQRYYGGAADVMGRTAEIAGERVEIAGVVKDSEWHLPGRVQAVLVGSAEVLSELSPTVKGFVIGRMGPTVEGHARPEWRQMVDYNEEQDQSYDCIHLTYLAEEPLSVFVFALLLAGIALPATTPLQLGEYPRSSRHVPLEARLRRWRFLVVKTLLAVPAVGLWSLALAYGCGSWSLSSSIYAELGVAFPGLLLALRWILHDQRNRCPECLRLLSNPARVGQPSHNFLSWNGTELICTDGHGLLHIPELQTSWCNGQRWLTLDSSWLCLFGESGAAAAEGI